jgi:hypothetical protein
LAEIGDAKVNDSLADSPSLLQRAECSDTRQTMNQLSNGHHVFISFRHQDGLAEARRIRRFLKSWRPPRQLESLATHRPKPYMDEYDGGPTEDYWEHSLLPNLLRSEWLVVLITDSVFEPLPTGEDNWVIREIDAFVDRHGVGRVLPVYSKGLREKRLPPRLRRDAPRMHVLDLGRSGR